jgi:hypothetical protein
MCGRSCVWCALCLSLFGQTQGFCANPGVNPERRLYHKTVKFFQYRGNETAVFGLKQYTNQANSPEPHLSCDVTTCPLINQQKVRPHLQRNIDGLALTSIECPKQLFNAMSRLGRHNSNERLIERPMEPRCCSQFIFHRRGNNDFFIEGFQEGQSTNLVEVAQW